MFLIFFVEEEKWDMLDGNNGSNEETMKIGNSNISKEKVLKGLIDQKVDVQGMKVWFDYRTMEHHQYWWREASENKRYLFATNLNFRVEDGFDYAELEKISMDYDALYTEDFSTYIFSPRFCCHIHCDLKLDPEGELSLIKDAVLNVDTNKYKIDKLIV